LLAALLLGCGPSGPDESVACPVATKRWESGGHLQVVACQQTGGSVREEAGTRSYAMQLELDLKVLADTQIFATGSLVHKSGPEGQGHRRPAGEVVTVREELLLVETDAGWKVPR
jgi:hypothetical protein